MAESTEMMVVNFFDDNLFQIKFKKGTRDLSFDGVSSFDFHGGYETFKDIVWLMKKRFNLDFADIPQDNPSLFLKEMNISIIYKSPFY